ncbi:MAG: hypothetical protein DRP84_10895 [Spirochaetes bacterium]|nr:MAG: hypothetical protein DRP84_10895 [Spirochaetota bacterium]
MEIPDNKKIDILLHLLSERYTASHRMRERSLNFAIWILGFGIAMIWMLLSEISLTFSQRIILTIFAVIIGCLTKKFLNSIEVGFDRNRNVMIKIEEVLRCYESNIYCNSPLFPQEYKNLDRKETSHFISLYLWLWTTVGMVMTLIWLEPLLKIVKQVVCKGGG